MNISTTCEVPFGPHNVFPTSSAFANNPPFLQEESTMVSAAANAEDGLNFIVVHENDILDKVMVGLFWGILEIPVNAGLMGLVQFDRLGGDPLKRRITDQVGIEV